MRKLTKKDKKDIINELKRKGWVGSLSEESLLILAQKILEKQLQ